MQIRVGLENDNEGIRSLAWALEHPGCFAYGSGPDQALEALPQAYREYADWVAARTADPWLPAGPGEFKVEEVWTDFTINSEFDRAENGDYRVDPFFQHDWKPLSEMDIHRGLQLLAWARADLIQTVAGLDPEALERAHPNERWPISGILGHIGGAEWWYLDRLGLGFPRQQVPADPFKRLERVRARLNEVLPGLAGSGLVVGLDGEFWSPRKLLRRAVWHERDHIAHIRKLI